jgi:hypothetical protein
MPMPQVARAVWTIFGAASLTLRVGMMRVGWTTFGAA